MQNERSSVDWCSQTAPFHVSTVERTRHDTKLEGRLSGSESSGHRPDRRPASRPAGKQQLQSFPLASSAACTVARDMSSKSGVSDRATAPYVAYHFAARSDLASIRIATPPTSVAASRHRRPAARISCPPRLCPWNWRLTANLPSRKTGAPARRIL